MALVKPRRKTAAHLDETGEHEEGHVEGGQDDHADQLVAVQPRAQDAQRLADEQQLKGEREEQEELHCGYLVPDLRGTKEHKYQS